MIDGGNATLFVSDMDRSVDFYTNVLGLELRFRAENHWAEVVAGKDLVLGIHPASANAAPPGTVGAIQIGLNVTVPLEEVRRELAEHGLDFSGEIKEDEGVGRLARMADPDGNCLYFWEPADYKSSSEQVEAAGA